MKKLLLLVLFLTVLLMVMTVALYQWLGWSGLLVMLAVIVLLGWFIKLMAGRLLQRLFMMPFKAKGAVLAGAQTRVHAVIPAPPPASDADEENDEFECSDDLTDEEWTEVQATQDDARRAERNRRYCYIDVTITPATPGGQGFTFWEPSEMSLVKPDTKNGLLDDEAAVGEIVGVKIWNEGEWRDNEEGKYFGPQRIQLHAGIDPAITHARFAYYFEVFGDLYFDAASFDTVSLPEFSGPA